MGNYNKGAKKLATGFPLGFSAAIKKSRRANNNIIAGMSRLKAPRTQKAIRIFGIRSISVTVSEMREYSDTRTVQITSVTAPGVYSHWHVSAPTRARSAACTRVYVHDELRVQTHVHGAVAVGTGVAQAKTSTVNAFFSSYLLETFQLSRRILYHSLKSPRLENSRKRHLFRITSNFFIRD